MPVLLIMATTRWSSKNGQHGNLLCMIIVLYAWKTVYLASGKTNKELVMPQIKPMTDFNDGVYTACHHARSCAYVIIAKYTLTQHHNMQVKACFYKN